MAAPEKVTKNNPFLRLEYINNLLYVFLSFVNITELLHTLRPNYNMTFLPVKRINQYFIYIFFQIL